MSSVPERSRSTFATPTVDSRTIAIAGMMLAFVFVMTRFPSIPFAGGYIHLGDAAINAAAFLFGPIVAVFSAAFGTAFSDLSLGYGSYAPGTFVIHGIQGLVVGFMAWRRDWMAMIAAAIVGGAIVVGGYFVYQWLILREGLGPAVSSLGMNTLQVVVGGILGIALVLAVRRAYPPVTSFGQTTAWEDHGTS